MLNESTHTTDMTATETRTLLELGSAQAHPSTRNQFENTEAQFTVPPVREKIAGLSSLQVTGTMETMLGLFAESNQYNTIVHNHHNNFVKVLMPHNKQKRK